MRLHLCNFSIFFLTLCSNLHALETSFQDGEFLEDHWETNIFVLDDPKVGGIGPGTSSGSITRKLSGGNGGPFRESSHTIVYRDIILTSGLYTTLTYNPRSQGAITDIDFSVDLRHAAPGATAWQLMIEQNDTIYFSYPFGLVNQNLIWETLRWTPYVGQPTGLFKI